MNTDSATSRWIVAGFSVALFAVSLFLPALLFADHEPESGGTVLAWGWWGLLTADFAWFANPAFALAVIAFFLKWNVAARLLAGGALGLGALSFRAEEWWFNEGSGTPIVGLGSAFYFWMASFGVLFVGSWVASTPNKATANGSGSV